MQNISFWSQVLNMACFKFKHDEFRATYCSRRVPPYILFETFYQYLWPKWIILPTFRTNLNFLKHNGPKWILGHTFRTKINLWPNILVLFCYLHSGPQTILCYFFVIEFHKYTRLLMTGIFYRPRVIIYTC